MGSIIGIHEKRLKSKSSHTSVTDRIPSPLGPNPSSIFTAKSAFLSCVKQTTKIAQLKHQPSKNENRKDISSVWSPRKRKGKKKSKRFEIAEKSRFYACHNSTRLIAISLVDWELFISSAVRERERKAVRSENFLVAIFFGFFFSRQSNSGWNEGLALPWARRRKWWQFWW